MILEKKPLEDWTLKEVKERYELCEKSVGMVCELCPIVNVCSPEIHDWELVTVQWTSMDRLDARAIKRLYPSAEKIVRRDTADVLYIFGKDNLLLTTMYQAALLLQSLQCNKEVQMSKMLEDEDG